MPGMPQWARRLPISVDRTFPLEAAKRGTSNKILGFDGTSETTRRCLRDRAPEFLPDFSWNQRGAAVKKTSDYLTALPSCLLSPFPRASPSTSIFPHHSFPIPSSHLYHSLIFVR
ncbi:uncharacterized protein VTP21DRAFT_7723 [Calcarisporiella thermophila]|uniref:uncharacterized protein n=1 Tax=Calcarisporiella thermophila TaxID=911321 RepID=UPI003744288A